MDVVEELDVVDDVVVANRDRKEGSDRSPIKEKYFTGGCG